MKNVLSIFLFLLLLCSCETTKPFTESNIKIDFKDEDLHSSSVFKIQKIIKLESSSSDAMLKSTQRILCADSLLFVLDKEGNKIVAFDYDGRFLGSTLGLVGHAKNEYIHFTDAAIDNINHLIYLYCDRPSQMMILDYKLNVKDCVKIKDLFLEFTIDSSYVYALCPDLENESHYELRRYRRSDLDGKYDVIIDQREAIRRLGGLGKWINGNGNAVYASMPFDNTIYEIIDGTVKRHWSLDFDGKWFDYSRNKNLQGFKFSDNNRDMHWTIQNIVASDTTLLFNTNKSNVFKASMSSGNGGAFSNIINDSIPFSSSWLIPTNLKNGIAFKILSSYIVNYKNYYIDRHEDLPAHPINNIIEKTKDGDNPLIILGTVR